MSQWYTLSRKHIPKHIKGDTVFKKGIEKFCLNSQHKILALPSQLFYILLFIFGNFRTQL